MRIISTLLAHFTQIPHSNKEWLPKMSQKRKTWLEYKEWLPKMSFKKKNMVGKDKHDPNYERKTRVLY